MCNRPSVTIDAGVLAVPDVDCAIDAAFQYVDTLLDWRRLLDEPWAAIYMSENASIILVEEGLFPLRNYLQQLFERHGIVEYSVNDVAKIAERLLSVTPSFERYYRVKDVLCEQLTTEPDVISLTTYTGLQSDLARCIALLAILRRHCSQPLGGHSMILREAPRQMIQVRAHIHDIEHSRDDILALPTPPDFFEGEVLVCDDFRGLIECIDEEAILFGADDNLGVKLAIRIALFKFATTQGDDPDWDASIIPDIGLVFRELCQRCCADVGGSLPSRILRSIVETVHSLNLPAVHAIRTGPGGNNPQRMRNLDKAQRRDIDNDFHLHYWECANGSIELASVVYHNDFSIPG